MATPGLTEEQKAEIARIAHQEGLSNAQFLATRSALVGGALGWLGPKALDKKGEPILIAAGAVTGLLVGIVGGYFAGSSTARKLYEDSPDLLPSRRVLPPSYWEAEEDLIPGGFAW